MSTILLEWRLCNDSMCCFCNFHTLYVSMLLDSELLYFPKYYFIYSVDVIILIDEIITNNYMNKLLCLIKYWAHKLQTIKCCFSSFLSIPSIHACHSIVMKHISKIKYSSQDTNIYDVINTYSLYFQIQHTPGKVQTVMGLD